MDSISKDCELDISQADLGCKGVTFYHLRKRKRYKKDLEITSDEALTVSSSTE